MENASKAILIAGGMLITMLVVSIIVLARTKFSTYYNTQQDFKDIQDVTEFNKQFTSYERTNITGNELLSLINKIVDYNNRESDKATNNYQASPIDFYLELGNVSERKKFAYEGESILFTFDHYYIDNTNNSAYTQINITKETSYNNLNYGIRFKDEIVDAIAKIGCEDDISKIAKDIKGIFDTYKDDDNESEKLSVIRKYNSYITTEDTDTEKYTLEEEKVKNAFSILMGEKKDAVYKYYEYMQFKKGIFKCTGIEYNTDTGRVSKLKFEFTGNIQ